MAVHMQDLRRNYPTNDYGDPRYAYQGTSSAIDNEDTERITCNCGKSFKRNNKLRYHQKWECGQIIKCDICNKTVTTFYSLRNHLQTHSKKMLKNKGINLNMHRYAI